MSAARFGAVAMETGAGSGETPLFLLTTPCLRLFLASVYLSLGLQGSGVELDLRTPGEVTTELGSASGGTSCLTQVQSWHIEGPGGHRIWSHAGGQNYMPAAPSPLEPGFIPMSRTDFRAAVSPERLLSANPHQFRWTLSLSSRGSVLSLPYSRGDPAYPPPEMVTQMVIWEESGPTVIHPGFLWD